MRRLNESVSRSQKQVNTFFFWGVGGRERRRTHDQVSQQARNRNLADRGDVDGGLLLDSGSVEVAERREVDAHGAFADEVRVDLVLLVGDAADDDVADGEHLLQAPALLVRDLVAGLLDALAAGEELDAGDVDRVDGGAVVGEQRGEGSAVDLGAVDDGDGLAEEAVAGGEDGVVDLQVLEDLDDGEGRAGQDGLAQVGGRVEEADVVVHIVDVLVAEALDVLGQRDGLLDVLVVSGVAGEDGVVDDDAVDLVVLVGLLNLLLELLLVDATQVKIEAADEGGTLCQSPVHLISFA